MNQICVNAFVFDSCYINIAKILCVGLEILRCEGKLIAYNKITNSLTYNAHENDRMGGNLPVIELK